MSLLSSFFQNTDVAFIVQCCAFSCVILVGFAAGSALRMCFPSKKGSSFRATRFVSICLFLSIAAILYTILVFTERELFWFLGFSAAHPHYLEILLCVFLFSALLSLFWKILIPVTIVLYGCLSILTACFLQEWFGEQKDVCSLVIDEQELVLDGVHIPRYSEDAPFLLMKSCVLPSILILPIRRNWACLEYSHERISRDETISAHSAASDLAFFEQERSFGLLKYRFFQKYARFVLVHFKTELIEIPIPDGLLYPSLFSVHVVFHSGAFRCELIREI